MRYAVSLGSVRFLLDIGICNHQIDVLRFYQGFRNPYHGKWSLTATDTSVSTRDRRFVICRSKIWLEIVTLV